MKLLEDDHCDQPWAFPARARQYHRVPSFGKLTHLTLVDEYSFPVMGLEKEESRLSWVWYLVAPVTDPMVSVTELPLILAPLAGLRSAGG